MYFETLDDIAPNNFHDWNNDAWKALPPLITEEVVSQCFSNQTKVADLLSNYSLILRPIAKKMRRIDVKKSYVNWEGGNFKIVSDLMASRIHVSVDKIKETIDNIQKIVLDNNGQINIRNMDDNDICQYIYIYLPTIGIMEIQIGHPFAFYTFGINSRIREGETDLFKLSKQFNGNMKSKINGKNNDFDALAQLKSEFGDREIPTELLDLCKN
jgi:hypothetical protein